MLRGSRSWERELLRRERSQRRVQLHCVRPDWRGVYLGRVRYPPALRARGRGSGGGGSSDSDASSAPLPQPPQDPRSLCERSEFPSFSAATSRQLTPSPFQLLFKRTSPADRLLSAPSPPVSPLPLATADDFTDERVCQEKNFIPASSSPKVAGPSQKARVAVASPPAPPSPSSLPPHRSSTRMKKNGGRL